MIPNTGSTMNRSVLNPSSRVCVTCGKAALYTINGHCEECISPAEQARRATHCTVCGGSFSPAEWITRFVPTEQPDHAIHFKCKENKET